METKEEFVANFPSASFMRDSAVEVMEAMQLEIYRLRELLDGRSRNDSVGILEDLAHVRAERQATYGNHVEGSRHLGRAWAATLQNHLGVVIPDLSPHLVHLLMVQLKVLRASHAGSTHRDNFLDMTNYTLLAYDALCSENKKGEV